MGRGKAEDAGGLSPGKDDNAVHTPFLPPNFTDSRVCRLYHRISWKTGPGPGQTRRK